MKKIKMLKTGCYRLENEYKIFEQDFSYDLDDTAAEKVLASGYATELPVEKSAIAAHKQPHESEFKKTEKMLNKELKNKMASTESNKNGF